MFPGWKPHGGDALFRLAHANDVSFAIAYLLLNCLLLFHASFVATEQGRRRRRAVVLSIPTQAFSKQAR